MIELELYGGDAYNEGLPGQCYMAATRLAEHLSIMEGVEAVQIHHGIVSLSKRVNGIQRIMHAWVAFDLAAGDGRLPMIADASNVDLGAGVYFVDDYYSVGKVNADSVRKYDLDQARQHMLSLGHFGPWEKPLEPSDDWGDLDESRLSGGFYRDDDWTEDQLKVLSSLGIEDPGEALLMMAKPGGIAFAMRDRMDDVI